MFWHAKRLQDLFLHYGDFHCFVFTIFSFSNFVNFYSHCVSLSLNLLLQEGFQWALGLISCNKVGNLFFFHFIAAKIIPTTFPVPNLLCSYTLFHYPIKLRSRLFLHNECRESPEHVVPTKLHLMKGVAVQYRTFQLVNRLLVPRWVCFGHWGYPPDDHCSNWT